MVPLDSVINSGNVDASDPADRFPASYDLAKVVQRAVPPRHQHLYYLSAQPGSPWSYLKHRDHPLRSGGQGRIGQAGHGREVL